MNSKHATRDDDGYSIRIIMESVSIIAVYTIPNINPLDHLIPNMYPLNSQYPITTR